MAISLSHRIPITIGLLAVTVLSAAIAPALLPRIPVVAAEDTTANSDRLANTSWQLAAWSGANPGFPLSRTALTLRFADGSVSGSAGCNTFRGSYQVKGTNLTLAQLATTRKACPGNIMQQESRYLSALQAARRYRINRNGQLQISYGTGVFSQVLTFNPQPVTDPTQKPDAQTRLPSVRGIRFDLLQSISSETQPNPAVEAAILREFPGYGGSLGSVPDRYFYNLVDLNDDGRQDAVVYLLGSYFCGTGGCSLLVLQATGDQQYRTIGSIPTSRQPVIVTDRKTRGWKDLVRPTSGGGASLNYSLIRFNGREYEAGAEVPSNSTVRGTAVIADQLSTQNGIPLKPQ